MKPDGERRYPKLTRVMRLIHVYSAMPVLLLLVFFAVTGFYLNHPELGEGEVVLTQRELTLPDWARGDWSDEGPPVEIVLKLLHWLDQDHGVSSADFAVEFDSEDGMLVIDLASPSGTTLVEVVFDEKHVLVDDRALSALATLNNLHRAKHVTGFWIYLSDLSALAMLLFCTSGFWLVIVNRFERLRASVMMLVGGLVSVFAIVVLH